jgi:hypothetical protein
MFLLRWTLYPLVKAWPGRDKEGWISFNICLDYPPILPVGGYAKRGHRFGYFTREPGYPKMVKRGAFRSAIF